MVLMVAFAYAGDCKIYNGNYASHSNLLGTVKGDKIYKGDDASYSNLVATGKDCLPRD